MGSVKDTPAQNLIDFLAEYLKDKERSIKPPSWLIYAKTGSHKERLPTEPDWWYIRCASLLRKVSLAGYVGVERLKSGYGGSQRRGPAPSHKRRGSGSIIREALAQLEESGLVAKEGSKGRTLTPKGRSLLDRITTRILKDKAKEKPELKKYLES